MTDDGDWREMMDRYDELASIAGEMAGAFKTALREIKMTYKDDPGMFDEDWEPSLAALSRYTAFMEGKG